MYYVFSILNSILEYKKTREAIKNTGTMKKAKRDTYEV